MNTLQLFTLLLMVQLFWSMGVTLLVPNMPNAASDQVIMFNNSNGIIDIGILQSSVDAGIGDQTNIPLLEVGALVFYSSATIISLMVNFFAAIPQMVTLLISVFFLLVPSDPIMVLNIRTWVAAIVGVLYAIALFTFIAGARATPISVFRF